MFTISNSLITFTYQMADLRQLLQQLSAQLSLTLTSPVPDLPVQDVYAITDDETSLVDQLLRDSAVTTTEEFDKLGSYTVTDDVLTFSAKCVDSFQNQAPVADRNLQNWLVWHTLTRWLRLRHLDADANQTLMQANLYYAALHRNLFPLRNG